MFWLWLLDLCFALRYETEVPPIPDGFQWTDVPLSFEYDLARYHLRSNISSVAGRNGTIICIHGHFADYEGFYYLASAFASYDMKFYAVDFHSELSGFSPSIIHRQADFVARVVQQLCSNQTSPCHVIAHSMGGLVAIELMRLPASSLVRSVHTLSSPLRQHPAPIAISWAPFYARLNALLPTIKNLWSWSSGLGDTMVPVESSLLAEGSLGRSIVSSSLPGLYKVMDHIGLAFNSVFVLDFLIPAVIDGKIPQVSPRSFLVHATNVTHREPLMLRSTSGCSATGPVRLLVDASCPLAYLEINGSASQPVMLGADGKWSRVSPVQFRFTGGASMNVATCQIQGRVDVIIIPRGLTVKLVDEKGRDIREIKFPGFSKGAILTVTAEGGVIGSDGSAGLKSVTVLSTASVWVVGKYSVEVEYSLGVWYVVLRHWHTLLGYLMSAAISSGSSLGVRINVILVLLCSMSALHLVLFLVACVLGLLLSAVLTRIRVKKMLLFPVNGVISCVCPFLGLLLVTLQHGRVRNRSLIFLMLAFVIPSLTTLLMAVWQCLQLHFRAAIYC